MCVVHKGLQLYMAEGKIGAEVMPQRDYSKDYKD